MAGSTVRDFAPHRSVRRHVLTGLMLLVLVGLGLHIGTVLFPMDTSGSSTSPAGTTTALPGACDPLPSPIPLPPVPTTRPVMAR